MPYNPFIDEPEEAEEIDEFGHTEVELARLDQADFEWKLETEDKIGNG